MKIFSNPQTALSVTALATDTVSEAVEWASYYGISAVITLDNTSTFSGGLKVQWSHDGTNFVDLITNASLGYTPLTTLTADGTYGLVYVGMIPAKFIRLVATRTAGTADVTVTWMATKV